MLRTLLSRVGQAALVLLAAYTVTFAVLHLVPGDPVSVMLTAGGERTSTATPQEIAALEARFGLDRPVVEQYVTQLTMMLRGDFGLSYATGNPAMSMISERAAGTLALSLVALLLAAVGGLLLACLATTAGWRPLRLALRRLPAVGVSVPTFWSGLLLIQLFAFTLAWLPSGGSREPSSVVLPALTLALPASAVIAQVLIKGFDEVMGEPYIETARMKGLSRARVLLQHALPNAAAPAVTMLALIVGNMITGTVVVETVFSRSGLGRLVQESVMTQDLPVVQAIVMLAAVLFVTINLVADLVYPLLDPRQRPEPQEVPL